VRWRVCVAFILRDGAVFEFMQFDAR